MFNDTRTGFDNINSAIGLLYDAVLAPDLWPRALDDVAALSGAMGLMVGPIRQNEATPFVYASNPLEEACASFSRDWYSSSPFMVYERRSPVMGRCIWDGDVYALEDMKRLQFYQEYARPFDMAHCMMRGTGQIAASGRYVMMAPSHVAQGVPDPHQRRVFETLTAHAEKALAMSLRVNAVGEALEGAWSLMDRGDCGIVLLNRSGTVVAANDVAHRMGDDGFRIVDGKMIASLPGQRAELDRLLGAALTTSAGQRPVGSVALKRRTGKRPLLVNAVPVRAQSRDLFPACLASASLMIIIVDLDSGGAPNVSSLFRLLGLTETESRVAATLGTGESPETAARKLCISIGTVRNHIKRIFSKLDVSRQSELVALVAKLAILPDDEAQSFGRAAYD